jgi:ABC-type branched-subunit amino acid transport system ATPase component
MKVWLNKGEARQRWPAMTMMEMCAIGRGLMASPRLLLLDEPALGLAPLLVREMFASLRTIREQGVTIVLVANRHRGEELERPAVSRPEGV